MLRQTSSLQTDHETASLFSRSLARPLDLEDLNLTREVRACRIMNKLNRD